MKRVPPDQLLARLQRLNVATPDEAAAVQAMLAEEPTLLVSEALRDVKHLDWDTFVKLLCEEFGSEHVPPELLAQWPIQPEALELVPSQMAHELAVFPLDYDAARQRLLVVTAYPFNPHAVAELGDTLPVEHIEATFCREDVLADLLRRGYLGTADLAPELGEHTGDEPSFDIGAASDEEAFPGLYGSDVSTFLYEEEGSGEGDGVEEMSEGVHGSLAHLGVVDMLQALSQSRKTCSIFIDATTGSGSIHLEDGWVIHAETPAAQGEEAIYEILGMNEGHFEIIQRSYSGERTMQAGVEGLLLEGMRRLDEANR